MRILLLRLALALLIAAVASAAQAQPASLHAGIARLTAPAGDDVAEPFDALVWYPTPETEGVWRVGPFRLPARHGAKVATGRLPVVLLSHGGGPTDGKPTGGSPMQLGELSASLARRGFIVIAPFHGTARSAERVAQLRSAFGAVMADSRFADRIDANRLGTLGFSLGGAVALELAGGQSDVKAFNAYCAEHPEDAMTCNGGPGEVRAGASVRRSDASPSPPVTPLRPKAIVLLDPLGVPFTRDGLSDVTQPVLLYRPRQSKLGEANARGLTGALPRLPQLQFVPGGHFIFTDTCPPALKAEAPILCEDAPSIDRAAIRSEVAAKVATFFRDNL